jgi:hypothetical protein
MTPGDRQDQLGLGPRAAWLLLLVASVVEFLRESWQIRAQPDDAYISYRYARNLVEGHGLVYNTGEYVEGFTNLLWTLLVAAGMALGFEGNVVGHALGLASGVAILLVTYLYACTGLSRSQAWIAAVAPWIVLSTTSFTVWSTSGMETPLFVATTTAALAAYARERMGWATLAVCLAMLTRPEGAIVAAIIYGLQLPSLWRDGWSRWKWPLTFLVLLSFITLFRLSYYGSPLPNTFYAKVGGIPMGRGVSYVKGFLADGSVFLLIPVAIAAACDRRWWAGIALVFTLVGYAIWIGGDVFVLFRFLLPLIPCLAVLAVRGVAHTFERNRYAGVIVSISLPLSASFYVFGAAETGIIGGATLIGVAWIFSIRFERRWLVPAVSAGLAAGFSLYLLHDFPSSLESLSHSSKRTAYLQKQQRNLKGFEDLGKYRAKILRDRGEPIRLVATGAIGSFGYYSRLPILDIYGLVDPNVARSTAEAPAKSRPIPGHQRSNTEYVFARKPEYILIPKRRARRWIETPAQVMIRSHPELDEHYEWDDQVRGYRRQSQPVP